MKDTVDLDAERQAFEELQSRLPEMFERLMPDRIQPRTVLIVPSLTLDEEVLAKVSGAHHYELRMLCLLLLLRLPQTKIIYVSSEPIPDSIIDYYLHLLTGIPHQHARDRLILLPCHDSSDRALSDKVMERPRLLERIRAALGEKRSNHMVCYNVTPVERRLALELDVPIFGCDPDLQVYGTKSGGRKLFREAGLRVAEGYEDLGDAKDLCEALIGLKARNPGLNKAVVKLNDGFSGEGNAVFHFHDSPDRPSSTWIGDRLPALAFEAGDMHWDLFSSKIVDMGCIAEVFIESEEPRTPSVQYSVDPSRRLQVISTHDQVMGGSGQVFLGCRFPADDAYGLTIQNEGLRVAALLRDKGVLGRFGVDFISVREGDEWVHYACEINLRKGGTTHPYIMLQFLTDGSYDAESGQFRTADGLPRCYYATDNLESERYRGLTPNDLIDIAVRNDIHFHGAAQRGVVFHLISALSEFGKLGTVCVGENHEEALQFYRQTVEILDREGNG